ncbi:uroporphyrinogen decarboxylase [Campylobacter corcagiensis]|uniref:Uroporphyrinogen decarboxylase n=1 Tax=Campylobacter corcagiensis TaxID=1448857 RepID=A0A7M1LDJ0_9BACT|nr:uroporphyrinogen decarboxylase [Campylobacter corcagiensis]QKF65224.1 uroporphyrinogen decarboxylase [Campylobacter corcagiensis]QOQ86639.1 uroporphyrinogen decarboxylase [Campylobacter corcagiensis]
MIFVDACFGKKTPYTPVWMMRQAGRYLPEYRAVRESAGGFIGLCKDYKKASEVTIQPVDILGVDAAILFSDILVLPMEMGLELEFVAGKGPVFHNPVLTKEDIKRLDVKSAVKNLSYVYDTVKLTRDNLKKDKALIGFAGAPWTVATYMIEGGSTKSYNICKKMLYTQPELLHEILAKVTEGTKLYLENQIKAGVNAVQIFDSWAGALERDVYLQFGWRYILEIADYIKAKYPEIPVIAFPKGIGSYLDSIGGNFDVFGVSWDTPIRMARNKLSDRYTLQGNMEPCRLYSKETIKSSVTKILNIMDGYPHIFNLGHGILPDVPVENAKYFIKLVQEMSAR